MFVIGGDQEISLEQNSMEGSGKGRKVHNQLRSSKMTRLTIPSPGVMKSLHITFPSQSQISCHGRCCCDFVFTVMITELRREEPW